MIRRLLRERRHRSVPTFAREGNLPEILAEVVSVGQLLRLERRRTKQFNDPRTLTEWLPTRLAHRNAVRASGLVQERGPLFPRPPPPLCGPHLFRHLADCRQKTSLA